MSFATVVFGSLIMPRGPDPWGQRYVGEAVVRKGLATRFEGIPDVHYGDVHNWVSGNHGVSRWTLTGTTKDGKKIMVRGCDLLEFRNGKIIPGLRAHGSSASDY
jgi:ketosteroid isomerase-like protein